MHTIAHMAHNSEEEPLEEEEIISDDEMANPAQVVKRLREQLVQVRKEKQQYLENWQRMQADFANYKRQEHEFQEQRMFQLKVIFAESLIPTLDSFEMALQDKTFQQTDVSWKKGVEAVYQGLLKSLEQMGVARYTPLGEQFNPHLHEALQEVSTDEKTKDHTVEAVHRAGYSIGDRAIRPAQVSIYTLRTE